MTCEFLLEFDVTTPSTLSVRVRAMTWEAQSIVGLELVPVSPLDSLPPFSAGAHIDLHLNTPQGPLVRSYSLLNDCRERHRYVVAVLKDKSSRGGSRAVHEHLRIAMPLTLSEPRNNFALVEDAAHTVLVAGGAGAVGNAAIQLARWAGATVLSTVSSDEKAALAELRRCLKAGACGVMVLACMDVVAVLRADMRRQTVGQWLSHPVTLQQSQWKLPMLAVHTWHRPQRLPQPVNAVLQLEGGA